MKQFRRDRPTLAELRERAHKQNHRAIGNWLARRVARPSAIYGTWLAVRLGLSANQVTTLALVANLLGAGLIATGTRGGFLAGVAVLWGAFWLDRVDGQIARWRASESLSGVYFDYLMHHAANLALGFGLGFGLTMRTGQLAWTAAGFLAAAGWLFLGLHNDCRYKAFFQRLKREDAEYVVKCGSAERPRPAPLPTNRRSVIVWTLYKLCESHVILIAITCIAMVELWRPQWGELALRIGVASWAALAPALAIGRAARAVRRQHVDRDFAEWFRPVDACTLDATRSARSDDLRLTERTLRRPPR